MSDDYDPKYHCYLDVEVIGKGRMNLVFEDQKKRSEFMSRVIHGRQKMVLVPHFGWIRPSAVSVMEDRKMDPQ